MAKMNKAVQRKISSRKFLDDLSAQCDSDAQKEHGTSAEILKRAICKEIGMKEDGEILKGGQLDVTTAKSAGAFLRQIQSSIRFKLSGAYQSAADSIIGYLASIM